MWEAMRSEIGWPPWREDPYVNRLEEIAADLTGKEAAMLVPTTSVANLLGMMGYCQRGDQAIMEARCHLCAELALRFALDLVAQTNKEEKNEVVSEDVLPPACYFNSAAGGSAV